MKIDVLGAEYTVEKRSVAEDPFLATCDGYCDKTTRAIVVATKDEKCTVADFDRHQRKVLRHEIIHAFLFESGLAENWHHVEFGHDETYVDWFAIQMPKMLKVFTEVGCHED